MYTLWPSNSALAEGQKDAWLDRKKGSFTGNSGRQNKTFQALKKIFLKTSCA